MFIPIRDAVAVGVVSVAVALSGCGADNSSNQAGPLFGAGGGAGASAWMGLGGAPAVAPVTCGDGVVQAGEMCDGANMNAQSCASVTMNALPLGMLSCTPTCSFVTAGCSGNVMGSGGATGFAGGPGTGGALGGGGQVAQGGQTAQGGAAQGGAAQGGSGPVTGPDPTSATASTAGPYAVQTYTNGFRDGPGYADATIHYPTGGPAPYPGVAVVPGFVSPQSSIQPWGPFLASHGIVTMTIGTNTPTDSPDVRANALLDALETLRSENTRAGGPLAGQMDLSRLGIMGWSMGGGGTLIAANRTPTLKSAISLCGWNPGGQYPTDTVPSLMFAATADPLAGGQSQGFYASIPASTPKMLFEVQGGNHNIANNPANQSGAIGRYGLSWHKVFLQGDERYRQFLQQQPTGTATFNSNL